MSRFLICTVPVAGHVNPGLPIARALVERGHEVRWYTGRKFRGRIEATGARFEPFRTAYDYDDSDIDAAFPDLRGTTGFRRMNRGFINIFMKPIGPYYHDLRAILDEFPADVLFADGAVWAATCITEKGGPPYAMYCETCLGIRSRDTAPFGLGMLPSSTPLGRLRNRALHALSANVLVRPTTRELCRQRASLGLRPQKFDGVVVSPYLLLEATVPSFEYPLSDIPPQVHFVGGMLADPPADAVLPDWWGEVVAKQRPVVLVTQGTPSTNPRDLIAPAVAGLAGEELLVVVAGASPEVLGPDPIPANARIAPFIPFGLALPHVDVFVTNGGFGGVHYALANGVPLVVAGGTEEKPEVANRVARTGAGVNLKTGRPTAEQVRAAVNEVLRAPGYRQQARRLQAELAQHDAPTESALLLEQLAATKRPVLARAGTGQRATAGAPPRAW
jgi:MGT family glycosyltransferase